MNENAYKKERRIALIYPLAVAFIIPGLIGLFQPIIIDLTFFFIMVIIISILPAYVIFRTTFAWVNGDSFFRTLLTCLKPLPTKLPVGTDLKKKSLPWVTFGLILANVLFHFLLTESTKDHFAFPPYNPDSLFQILAAFFMHAFIHGNNWHLIGNMIFLWVFGSTLETRIGPGRFLAIYIACIAASTIFYCELMKIAGTDFNSIGASGAIAGIMGVFAVRCYFARVTISMPFLFIPWVAVPVRVQALGLICLFFAIDAAGSMAMFGDNASHVNRWSHTGGYLFGFSMAYFFRFYRAAADESVSVKADRLCKNPYEKGKGAELYRDILEKDSNNVDALSFFLNHYKYDEIKQAQAFSALIKALTDKDIKQAVAFFDEYYPKYLNTLPGGTALKLGMIYYNTVQLEKARNCLQVAVNNDGPWQPKAMLFLGRVFEAMGNKNMAKEYYKQTREKFPGTVFAQEARVQR